MKARYIVIPVVAIGVVALTIWLVGRALRPAPQYELYEVRKGSVAKTVSVAGSVISDQKFELGFLSPGLVQTVSVKVGDKVEAGDLLVSLDTSILREQANQARAGIAAANAMLSKSRNALRPQDVTVFNRSLDSARVALTTAQSNLQDAYRARDMDINSAATGLATAETAYQNAVNAYSARFSVINQATIGASVALSNASNTLSNAQFTYNQVLNLYNLGQASALDLQQAGAALNAANSAYLSAQAAYNSAVQQANLEKVSATANIDSARTQLDSARAAYNSALSGIDSKIRSTQNALSAAEAAYNLATAQYQQLLAPAHAADIASASAQIASAAAAFRAVQAQIDKAYIKAPIAGIVTAVNATAHEISPIGAAVVLETIGAYQVEAYISEVDIEKIVSGAQVRITLDALPDIEARGSVAQIDPAATIMLGVVNYKINVAITDAIPDLRSAMTADLEILTEQREDVLFIPRKAVTRTDGKYLVQLMGTNNKTEDREVQVGLVGDNEFEIVSGLVEGDRIVLREL